VLASVALTLRVPAELGPEAELLAELRERVEAIEAERAAERQQTGARVYGRRAVLAQSWRSHPSSVEPRRNLRPQLCRNRAFLTAYAVARAAWRDGIAAVSPPGTYWLRRFAHVTVAEARAAAGPVGGRSRMPRCRRRSGGVGLSNVLPNGRDNMIACVRRRGQRLLWVSKWLEAPGPGGARRRMVAVRAGIRGTARSNPGRDPPTVRYCQRACSRRASAFSMSGSGPAAARQR
jgi:hypothetical protein